MGLGLGRENLLTLQGGPLLVINGLNPYEEMAL